MLPAGAKLLGQGRFGRLNKDGKTLVPDTRKGMLRIVRVRRTSATPAGPRRPAPGACAPRGCAC
jgi:hypothetical protein